MGGPSGPTLCAQLAAMRRLSRPHPPPPRSPARA
ncbi:DUF6053 domain-containing protein [Lysobacter enzymogenes]